MKHCFVRYDDVIMIPSTLSHFCLFKVVTWMPDIKSHENYSAFPSTFLFFYPSMALFTNPYLILLPLGN